MAIRCRFDAEKAIEVLLYIAASVPNIYNALKVLYFADKEHLSRYGRLICGDSYVAMNKGPVPSGAYDLVKAARGDGCCFAHLGVTDAFQIRNWRTIVPRRAANLDVLSESERECLDEAIKRYGRMAFGRLMDISHEEEAFKSADENDFIPLEAIARSLPDGEQLLEYLNAD